jgi:hypothetical protein
MVGSLVQLQIALPQTRVVDGVSYVTVELGHPCKRLIHSALDTKTTLVGLNEWLNGSV